MDNMLQLRNEYGSSVLEELNTQVFPYRRNVAGSITLILFAVHEALTTKLPLPQFLPSARLAHLRMVNRVRDVVFNKTAESIESPVPEKDKRRDSMRLQEELPLGKRIVQQKFLSWTEVIEYLEELIDLTKLLVGANEFRSGLLMRPTYRDYVERIGRNFEARKARLDGKPYNRRNEASSVIEREQAELRDSILGLRKIDSIRVRAWKKMKGEKDKASTMNSEAERL